MMSWVHKAQETIFFYYGASYLMVLIITLA